jgi:hypothetical protein
VRGVLLATPSNPTGTSIEFERTGRLVEVSRARGGFTLVDEIYLDLSYGHRPRSAISMGSDVLVAGSFSKFFHMTGWRLGWLVVPPALVSTFEKLAQNLFICPSALAQHAALACFEPEAMALYQQRRDEFQARRDFIVPALRELGFGIPVEPDGAFYVYVDCSAFGADSAQLATAMLEQAGVAMVPGEDFGSHQPQRYLRVSYATGPAAAARGGAAAARLAACASGVRTGQARPRARARGFHLGRPQVGGGLVEHAVDVLVAVGAAEALGHFHRLVDDHAVGHVDAVRQLVGADHQHTMFHRRQQLGAAVDMAAQHGVQRRGFGDAAMQQQRRTA